MTGPEREASEACINVLCDKLGQIRDPFERERAADRIARLIFRLVDSNFRVPGEMRRERERANNAE